MEAVHFLLFVAGDQYYRFKTHGQSFWTKGYFGITDVHVTTRRLTGCSMSNDDISTSKSVIAVLNGYLFFPNPKYQFSSPPVHLGTLALGVPGRKIRRSLNHREKKI